jgi:hypothetical protein
MFNFILREDLTLKMLEEEEGMVMIKMINKNKNRQEED